MMKPVSLCCMAAAGLAAVAACPAFGAESGETGTPPSPPAVIAKVSDKPIGFADLPPPRRFVTRHKTTIRGKSISYTVCACETYITNYTGEPIGRFFSFTYTKDDAAEAARPVIFVFNGGPGSASLWLHIGALGPKRVALDAEVNPSNTPPFGTRDNPFSLLDVADLVFIDPLGTGYSHAVGYAKDADFESVDADADSVARFIEIWLSNYGRWKSPKFVLGESYGSIRAAVLPRALMGGPMYSQVMRGITLDGVILLGTSLDVGVPETHVTGVDPSVGFPISSMAVTAWYHRRIDRAGRTAAEIYDDASRFGQSEFADAVHQLKDGSLSEADENRIAAKLESYTAIPALTWKRSGFQLDEREFSKQLLAKDGLEVGMYDSRYTLKLAGGGGDPVSDDPAMGRYVPGFVAAFNDLLKSDLKVDVPISYTAINFVAPFKWSFARTGVPEGQGFAVDLATAMRRTPKMRVFVASGYFDMLSKPASVAAQINKGGLPMDRVTLKNYESGHMLYLGETEQAFTNDLRSWMLSHP